LEGPSRLEGPGFRLVGAMVMREDQPGRVSLLNFGQGKGWGKGRKGGVLALERGRVHLMGGGTHCRRWSEGMWRLDRGARGGQRVFFHARDWIQGWDVVGAGGFDH